MIHQREPAPIAMANQAAAFYQATASLNEKSSSKVLLADLNSKAQLLPFDGSQSPAVTAQKPTVSNF